MPAGLLYSDEHARVTLAQIRALREVSQHPRSFKMRDGVYVRATVSMSLERKGWVTIDAGPFGREVVTITAAGLDVLAAWREAVAETS